jgi:hypothetical protein
MVRKNKRLMGGKRPARDVGNQDGGRRQRLAERAKGIDEGNMTTWSRSN